MIKSVVFFLSLFFISAVSAADSKLNTGDWHKITVPADGVYKIDYAFIQSNVNANPSNVSFNTFGVFGQGMGLLPEENSAFKVDDIVTIPFQVVDQNNNGFWNNGDYILFYAKGPDLIDYDVNTQEWGHTENFYTDVYGYFITTNQGSGGDFSDAPAVAESSPYVTSTDNWQIFEEEVNNLLFTELTTTAGSGRVWYGNVMNNISPTETIDFTVPNIVPGSEVEIKTKLAASAGTGSAFTVKANGATLYNQNLPGIPTSDYPDMAKEGIRSGTFTSGSNISVEIVFSNGDPQAKGWIDYVELSGKSQLTMNSNWLSIWNTETIDTSVAGETATFSLANASANTEIWDVTEAYNIQRVPSVLSGGNLRFSANTDDVLKKFVAVNTGSSSFSLPNYAGEVENQNLHGLENIDMVIFTNQELRPAAERIATLHEERDGLTVATVNIDQVYNEFSSGVLDLGAIRNFLKYLYDNGQADNSAPRYCLLMGDASFDYKDKLEYNENIIPTYESHKSLNLLNSYATDDFIGMLDDHEGGIIHNYLEPDLLDIAIGRIPVNTLEDANKVVDKIFHYLDRVTFGDWRNDVTFIADDEDGNLHLEDAEIVQGGSDIEDKDYYNFNKIYIDSYDQVNSSGGDRYPDVNSAILRSIFTGSLLINYIGHGGIQNWAQERIFNIDDIRNLKNIDKLPLFITATCDFAPFDDPGFHSAGESLLTNGDGGAIAMISTTRLVFASSNKALNRSVMNYLFQPVDGRMPTIGEVIMQAKNGTNSDENNRKFSLLGDPALTLAYPQKTVVTTEINGSPITALPDTLKALSFVTIKGEVQDNGALLSDFNGFVYPTVYDKPTVYETKANDPDSDVASYELQNNILFKGKSSVINGVFEFSFIVPKDINYAFGSGKISYYAEEANIDVDAHGYSYDFIVGGTDPNVTPDNEGPKLEVFINDYSFVSGGIANQNPNLLIRLSDDSGINTVGTGVGHDITALLNLNTQEKFVLNDYYQAGLDDFTSGSVLYPFNNLPDGKYRVDAKAWDIHNNPGEGFTEFFVVSSELLAIQNLFNYPNPFSDQTTFVFEHNRPGEILNIGIEVFDYTGKLVKTIRKTIQPEGTRLTSELTWDGTNDFGATLGRGAYIYRLSIRTDEGLTTQEIEKLIILR